MIVENICPDCFKEKGQLEVCPYCGFSAGNAHRELFHLPLGTVLEKRYIIGKVIGFSKLGIIYKAWDNELGMVVAVKEYYPGGLCTRTPGTSNVIVFSKKEEKDASYKNGLDEFLYEAQITAKFREHPYIVDVYNYFLANNTAYIVMEYLDGVSLDKYLKMAGGKLSYEDTVPIIEPIMYALEELHSKNIIHYDISIDNIFITIDNRIKLINLGAACFSNKNTAGALTTAIKLGHASTEQYSKGVQGQFTDVYALGVIIYKMLTGVTPEEPADRAINDELKRPSELGVELPLNAEKAVMKAMALNIDLRFKKVADMRFAFTNKNIEFPEEELRIRKTKRRIMTLLTGCAAIAAIILSYFLNDIFTLEASKIKRDSITVWIPKGDNYQTEEFADLNMGFLNIDGNEKFVINMVEIPEKEYEEKLLEAYGTESFPDIFRGDLVKEKTRNEIADSVNLYYMYLSSSVAQYYLLGYNANDLKKEKLIPVNLNVPVVYANLGLLSELGEDAPKSIISPAGLVYDVTKLKEKGIIDYSVVIDPITEPYVFKTLSAESTEFDFADSFGGIYKNGYDAFSQKRAVFYIGWTNELSKMQNVDELHGSYITIPMEGQKIYAEWGSCYSISNNSTLNKKRLAMFYLIYLTFTGSSNEIPLKKDSFADYVEANAYFLGFLDEKDERGKKYYDKIVID